jgi:hypothetical protein
VFPVRYELSILHSAHTVCFCVFRMVLKINSDYFPKQVNKLPKAVTPVTLSLDVPDWNLELKFLVICKHFSV